MFLETNKIISMFIPSRPIANPMTILHFTEPLVSYCLLWTDNSIYMEINSSKYRIKLE